MQHDSTKEGIVETATRYCLDAEVAVPVANRRSVSGTASTGPGGITVGREIQYHHLSAGSVHRS